LTLAVTGAGQARKVSSRYLWVTNDGLWVV
jgi:hypothetical protein